MSTSTLREHEYENTFMQVIHLCDVQSGGVQETGSSQQRVGGCSKQPMWRPEDIQTPLFAKTVGIVSMMSV